MMDTTFAAQVRSLSFPIALPPTLIEVEQQFNAPRVDDIPAAVRAAFAGSTLWRPDPAGHAGGGGRGQPGRGQPAGHRALRWWTPCSPAAQSPFSSRPWAATAAPQLTARRRCWPRWG